MVLSSAIRGVKLLKGGSLPLSAFCSLSLAVVKLLLPLVGLMIADNLCNSHRLGWGCDWGTEGMFLLMTGCSSQDALLEFGIGKMVRQGVFPKAIARVGFASLTWRILASGIRICCSGKISS